MRLRQVSLAVLILLAPAACGDGEDAAPEPTVPSTLVEDTTTVVEPPPTPTTSPRATTTRPPRTTSTVATEILSGDARISGTVLGPSGPVAGATVRVERLVGSSVATMDVAAPTGSFSLIGVRGGHYRLRAWKVPDFAQLEPEVFFLEADETKTVELRLISVGVLDTRATIVPETLPVNEPFTVSLLVYVASVDNQGVVTATTRPGLGVQLVVSAGLSVLGSDRGTTDAGGQVAFRVTCRLPVQGGAEAILDTTTRRPVALPACPAGSGQAPAPAPSTTTTRR